MKKSRRWFKPGDLTESTRALTNPARGWYQIYPLRVEEEPELEGLPWCLKKDETCALVLLDIGAYRDRELDDAALAHIHDFLGFFDEHKRDILLRVTYDREGRGMEREPSFFTQVLGHIRQLGPVFREFADRILLLEGMLVGNWGEMHGSKFLTKKHLTQLSAALAESAPGITRAVRRPQQWRMLNPEPPGPTTMVGLFNDGIFGSGTDLNTFAPEGSPHEGWEEPWPVSRELAFEEALRAFVPQCGEAVLGEAVPALSDAAERLRAMGMTYLNGAYDQRLHRVWREQSWEGRDPWRGMNGFDYIGGHLGYRFAVRSVQANSSAKLCEVTLTVENVGFSGFYQEAEVWLTLPDGREILTDWDIREWKSGETLSVTSRLPLFEGELWLSAKRKWDQTPIFFANEADNMGRVLLGEFKK